MKKTISICIAILCIVGVTLFSFANEEKRKAPTFEDAISIIKSFEGLSGSRHWPFVGYGHKVMPGEKFKRGKVLTEEEADALVREDYAKLCAKYRDFGVDSLLLAALAYNCGPGVVAKSSVLSKLKAGNRDIEASYKAHCRYRGKQLSQLKRRRETELAALFVKDPSMIEKEEIVKEEITKEGIKAEEVNIEHSDTATKTSETIETIEAE